MSIRKTKGIAERRSVVTAGHGAVTYRERGSGPGALFVHGVFLSADLWGRQLDELADLRRCVAVDLLAHGASACPPGELTVVTQADMVLEVIDALGFDQVDLVGNDSGGAVVQLVASMAPERVRTLTLTNCDTHDNWPPAAFAPIREMAIAGTLAPGLHAAATDPGLARLALADALERPDLVSDESLADLLGAFADLARAEAVQGWVAGMEPGPTVAVHGDLARLWAPTLVVWGTADPFFDVSWSRWLAATIPGTVRVVTVPGATLLFPLERPDALNRELRELWTNTAVHTVVNRYLEARNGHDLAAVADLHSADTVSTLHAGPVTHVGVDAVRAACASDLERWPDVHWEQRRRSVTGDECVLETTVAATAAARIDVLGATIPAGAAVRAAQVDLLTVSGGLITRRDTYVDVVETVTGAGASR